MGPSMENLLKTDPERWMVEVASRAEEIIKAAVVADKNIAALQLLRAAESDEKLKAFLAYRGAQQFVQEFYQRQNGT
jgi:hypothetical protein